ncbi:hypothetical protein CHS0354_023353 [Potamilus streckersoni]|uniref:DNA polymerase n=1 Tax=Potamilus streckersoni TaxID=2493646 RepID=A0AAE0T5I0_9BIVA|nr:hypothetical protein CHS0354_023353 [Potamilus streckersoni]
MAPLPANDNNVNDNGDNSESLAHSRTRREKIDKKGRASAFEKLRKVKQSGEKYKYDLEEEKAVYDVVDEDQYSEIVRQRQEDDWIIDDDGTGYVEDGREIFDEDLNDEHGSKDDKKKKDGVKKNPNIMKPGTKPKANIKSMFMAQAAVSKKIPEKDVSLKDDGLLGDLMEELHRGPSEGAIKPAPVKLTKKRFQVPVRSPHNPFSTTARVKPTSTVSKSTLTQHIKEEAYSPAPISRISNLPKPHIKEESVEEASSSICQYDSINMEGEGHESGPSQNIAEDCSMDFEDIDFDDDDIDNIKAVEAEPVEKLSIRPKTELHQIPEETVISGWGGFKNSQSDASTDVQVDSSQIPLVSNEEGEQVLRFFWLDAYEDQYTSPGVVYLFGKVWIESAKTFVSCCVTVKNIERRVFLLPRPTRFSPNGNTDTGFEVTIVDVYQEFNDKVVDKYKINSFKSRSVRKQYAFEKTEVPAESDYLEVRYSADCPALPSDLKGETFSQVFGTNTSSLELLLIERKMKGPSWLDIRCPQVSNPSLSWCKLEVNVTSPDNVTVVTDPTLAMPTLVVMTMNLRTLPNPKTHQNEVIGVACLIQSSLHMDRPAPKQPFEQHFCILTKPSDCIFPWDFKDKLQKEKHNMKVEVLPTERALLGLLLAKIHKIDPDLIVGHDIFGFDLNVLLHRINANKIPHWSKISRLKRTVMPKLSGHPGHGSLFAEKSATCGRMICDIKISSKELVRFRSFDLTELTSQILKQKRIELDFDQVKNMYMTSQQLVQLIELTLVDCTYILRIMYELNVIPLALQITNICGNIMSRTLMGGRSERNEYLLLHAFSKKCFIVPDKEYKKKQSVTEDLEEDELDSSKPKTSRGRRKPAYTGGLVLDPKKGFYDKYILLLDFNSLYPSIIQEYNICFTTINRSPVQKKTDDNEGDEEMDIELPGTDLEPGVLPTEIRKLVESRREVKKLMNQDNVTAEQKMQYDIRQKALKLTANSMYGCLGFTFSRFYARPLAALVTRKGREILMKTKDLVQMMNLDVIYGDTDSIMINTNCTDIDLVIKLGNKIKAEVNKLYKLLEIDVDGIFKSMLLLKKKKYAALSVHKTADGKYVTQEEKKGLDIVRRDWSTLAKETGDFVVSCILSGESREKVLEDIHSKLTAVGENVQENKLPLEQYLITKQLTKNPEDYPDKKSLPHVQVALRVNSKGGKRLKAGDTVPYVVCNDGSNLPPSQRAYHPEELAKSENLKIDAKYYLAQQVHPVVARLCDPIEGTDSAHLAECLGLDPSGYKHASQHHERDDDDAMLSGVQISEEEKYKDCERLKVICPAEGCGKEILIDSPFSGVDVHVESCLYCNMCKKILTDFVPQIHNTLTATIRSHIRTYYEGWLKCEDSACGTRVQKLPLMLHHGHPVCPACNHGLLHLEYTDSMLYTQLCFYQYIFDPDRAMTQMVEKEKERARAILNNESLRKMYTELRSVPEQWLKRNAYSEVNLNKLFEGLFTLK